MKPTNSKVRTPLGEGVVQGGWAVRQTEEIVRAVLVRIPLTDEIRKRLNDSNCMTPHATATALFVFRASEVS